MSDQAEFSEQEQMILDSHIRKNQAIKPERYNGLYIMVACITVFSPTFLFHAVLDMTLLDIVNLLIYCGVAAIAVYFMFEAYRTMFETESLTSSINPTGRYVRELEARRETKSKGISISLTSTSKIHVGKTAQEIFMAETKKSPSAWKELSKEDRSKYTQQQTVCELMVLGDEIAELRHLQYQGAMGWSLLCCNSLFIFSSWFISFALLSNYDVRVNYIVSLVISSLGVQLLAKHNDEKVKSSRA